MIEYLVILLDSNTPLPPELNGCKFTSLLPNISTFSFKHSDVLVDHHDAKLQQDKGAMYCQSCLLAAKVGYRNHVTNKYGVGIVSARDARLYTIYVENGSHISRKSIDLKCTYVHFELKTQLVVSTSANSKHAPPPKPVTNVKCTGKANLIDKEVEVKKFNTMYKMCSSHISKPVSRLITEM